MLECGIFRVGFLTYSVHFRENQLGPLFDNIEHAKAWCAFLNKRYSTCWQELLDIMYEDQVRYIYKEYKYKYSKVTPSPSPYTDRADAYNK